MQQNQQEFYNRVTLHLDKAVFKPLLTKKDSPLVSWIVISTLFHHNWPNRIIEYLTEDPKGYLNNQTELILFFCQEKNVKKKVRDVIHHIIASQQLLYPHINLKEKAKTIRIVEDYQEGDFYLCWARLRALQEAKGDFVLFRDADVRMIGYNLTLTSLLWALKYNLGQLGYPSLNNYHPFKPRRNEKIITHSLFPGILICNGVHGMATFSPTNVERELHRNPAIVGWGEHPSLCTKFTRQGLLMAYIDTQEGFMLATADANARITNLSNNPLNMIHPEKYIACSLLKSYYDVDTNGPFLKKLKELYHINMGHVMEEIQKDVEIRQPTYTLFQNMPQEDKFEFEPLSVLEYGELTELYIRRSFKNAAKYYDPIKEKIQKVGLTNLLLNHT